MSLYFSFEFSDSDYEGKGWERPITTFKFSVIDPFEGDSDAWDEWDDEVLMEQVCDMEEYGVHDFTGGDGPDGNTYFGYHSYEIKQDKWEEVMEKWHKWFVEQGFKPGEIEVEISQEGEGL